MTSERVMTWRTCPSLQVITPVEGSLRNCLDPHTSQRLREGAIILVSLCNVLFVFVSQLPNACSKESTRRPQQSRPSERARSLSYVKIELPRAYILRVEIRLH